MSQKVVVKVKNDNDLSVIGTILERFLDQQRDYASLRSKFFDLHAQVLHVYEKVLTPFAKRRGIQSLHDFCTCASMELAKHCWPGDVNCNDMLQLSRNSHNADERARMNNAYTNIVSNAFTGYVMQFGVLFATFKDQLLEPNSDPSNPVRQAKKLTKGDVERIGDAIIADHAFAHAFDLPMKFELLLDKTLSCILEPTHKNLCSVNLLTVVDRLSSEDYAVARLEIVSLVRNVFISLIITSTITTTPDMDPSIVKTLIEKHVDTHTDTYKKKYRRAISLITSSGDLMHDRFPVYYRDYVISGNISALMTGFITDCGKNAGPDHMDILQEFAMSLIEGEKGKNKDNESYQAMINSLGGLIKKHGRSSGAAADSLATAASF